MKELTVRSTYVGEPIARSVTAIGDFSGKLASRRVVILVHGFNVREEVARKLFRRYEDKLKRSLGPFRFGLLGTICSFHWPGDHSRIGLSGASFAARIPVARTCGERLADFITTLEPHQQVVLVAHSLGGQVVLRAMERIRHLIEEDQYSGPKVTHAFLMAAAVPVEMCDEGGLWQERLCEEHVFYSNRDLILKFLFGPGSNLYAKSGVAAVGQRGEPLVGRWSGRHSTSLGHGQYWDSETIAADISKSVLGSYGHNELPARQIEVDSSVVPIRPGRRRLNSRFLPERKRQ